MTEPEYSLRDIIEAQNHVISFLLLQLGFALPKDPDSDESPLLCALRSDIEKAFALYPGAREVALGIHNTAAVAHKTAVAQNREFEAAADAWEKAAAKAKK